MPNAPAAPVRQYSFTDHATYQPAVPRPGDKIDAELDRTNTALGAVLAWAKTSIAENGTLLPGALTIGSLDAATVAVINNAAADAAAAQASAATSLQNSINSALAAGTSATQATASAASAALAVTSAQAAKAQADTAAAAAAASNTAAQAAATSAATFKSDALLTAQTTATASAASATASANSAIAAQTAATNSATSAAAAQASATDAQTKGTNAQTAALAAQASAAAAAVSAQNAADALTASNVAVKYENFYGDFAPVPTAGQVIMRRIIPRTVTLPAGAPGRGRSSGFAAAAAVFNIQKNGTTVGTITWNQGGQIGTVSVPTQTSFAFGDALTVVGPASPDASLSQIGIVLTANYTP